MCHQSVARFTTYDRESISRLDHAMARFYANRNGRFMSGGHAALVDGKRRAGIVRHGRYRTESERDFTGPDEASVSSLPWRSRRTEDFFDAHRFNLLTEFISIDPITVSQEIFRRCFKAERNCHGRIRQPYIFVETPHWGGWGGGLVGTINLVFIAQKGPCTDLITSNATSHRAATAANSND